MKHFIVKLIAAITILLLYGCDTGDDLCNDATNSPLVVEGWIEEGEAPVVIVTHAADLTVDEPSFDNLVEKWCRVSIFDGDQQYVLTSHFNNAYMPPVIYTTSRLKGKKGHSYRLTVETTEDTLTAQSTILTAPKIERLEAEKVDGNDSLYSVKVFLTDIKADEYIKIFVKTLPDEGRYYPSFLGTVCGRDYNPEKGIVVTRGKRVQTDDDAVKNFSHYFKIGQTVIVHVCSMDRTMYDFWKIYDSNISLNENLFFTFAENLPTNINGGLGYFAAYGMSEGVLRIR
ncbi:MAG: DUF4249 domain-containing protein [Paramuribaculum sp.]|nr:DUF4249 domain-containing protein [Paramuribaculum sp.]